MCACVGNCCVGTCITSCLDSANQMLSDLCIRSDLVFVRTTVWDGGAPGMGTKIVTDLPIVPNPKVDWGWGARYQSTSGGRQATGDIALSSISRTFSRFQLTGEPIPTGTDVVWAIHSAGWETTWRIAALPEAKFDGWKIKLTKLAEAPIEV